MNNREKCELNQDNLVELYKARITTLGNLGDLKIFSATPIVAAFLILVAAYFGKGGFGSGTTGTTTEQATQQVEHLFIGAGLLLLGLSFSGINILARNWLNQCRYLTQLLVIEEYLNMPSMGIIPEPISYKPPKNVWHSLKGLFFNPKCTLMIFHGIVMFIGAFLVFRNLRPAFVFAITIVLTVLALWLCFRPLVCEEIRDTHCWWEDWKNEE